MLIQFSVENFKSFRDRAVLNMTASTSDNTHPQNYIEMEKMRYLCSAVIYGANASGKSNLLQALTSAILTIRHSNQIQINEPLIHIKPFQFDSDSSNLPTVFEFIFLKNNTKYLYGFAATQTAIIEEYLYVYNSAKPSLIFERTETNNYNFTKAEQKELLEISKRNASNKLLLATATAWNYEKTRDAYLWFAESINTYDNEAINNIPFALHTFDEANSTDLRSFTLNLLHNADINISDYRIDSVLPPPELVSALPKSLIDALGQDFAKAKTYQITTDHRINGTTGHPLDFEDESLGTKNLFCISPILYKAFSIGETIFIDEISSLHPLLVRYLITLFNDPSINKAGAQLVFTTHDTYLLSLDFFRRDQIYFTEKGESGKSELFSLDNFSVRKSENIRKAYLLGRYGAIPYIEGNVIL